MDTQLQPSTEEIKRTPPIMAIISVMFGIDFIVLLAFQWILVDYLTPFCMVPLLIVMSVILLILIGGSLIYLPLQFKKNRWRATLPLVINLIVFLIVWFVPFTDIWLDFQFKSNWEEYTKVVHLIEEGEIQVPQDGYGLVLLPKEYRHLSRGGGEVIVDTRGGVTRVFFFTFRGILDNFSGFMYRSDDTPPSPYDFGGDWKQIIKLRPHWYFCASA